MTQNKIKKKKIKPSLELLSPAGDMAKLQTAFFYGADAVYLGIPDFSLRVRINNFDFAGIAEAIEYAHRRGKKAYITANIFAHNHHLDSFVKYLKKLNKLKPDAFIASDPGIISLIKKHCPKIEIHLSTQANCTNLESARFWQKQGIKRIILGREVSLEEIKKIHKALPSLDLEYFVHGAMCMAYSGRCFLSTMFVGRSANLGDCAQPCRWQYDTSHYRLKARGHDEDLEIVSEEHGSYLLNSKDMCLVREIKELIDAGVISFKIEGRAKSVYYQAITAAIYRRALNSALSVKDESELKKELNYLYKELDSKLVHRGYSTGFLKEKKGEQNTLRAKEASAWEFCGQVLSEEEIEPNLYKKLPKRALAFKVHNSIFVGNSVEIILPAYQVVKVKIKEMFSLDSGESLDKAHGGGGGARVYIILDKKKTIPEGGAVICRRLEEKK